MKTWQVLRVEYNDNNEVVQELVVAEFDLHSEGMDYIDVLRSCPAYSGNYGFCVVYQSESKWANKAIVKKLYSYFETYVDPYMFCRERYGNQDARDCSISHLDGRRFYITRYSWTGDDEAFEIDLADMAPEQYIGLFYARVALNENVGTWVRCMPLKASVTHITLDVYGYKVYDIAQGVSMYDIRPSAGRNPRIWNEIYSPSMKHLLNYALKK